MTRPWVLLLRLVAFGWEWTHVQAQPASTCARLDTDQSRIWDTQDPNEPMGRRGVQFSYRFVVPHW